MILRNISKYCRPLTSVYTLSVVKESSLCMVWSHVVPISLLQLDSFVLGAGIKYLIIKSCHCFWNVLWLKMFLKKWDAHRWVWISCFFVVLYVVWKYTTWSLNCGTPNKLHVKTIKSSVWFKWQILSLSVRTVHVHTVLFLQPFERLPTSKSLFFLDLWSPEHYYCEKQSANLNQCLIFKPQNILRLYILNVIDG